MAETEPELFVQRADEALDSQLSLSLSLPSNFRLYPQQSARQALELIIRESWR